MKCGSYIINKNNRANATHGRVQSKECSETELMLDRRGSGPTWTCTNTTVVSRWVWNLLPALFYVVDSYV